MAGRESKKIIWRLKAKADFETLIDYISQDSPFAANNVGLAIIDEISNLPVLPEKFVKDSWKKNNDGSYRVFFKYHYRISYKITPATIYILRIRHTSQDPKEY
jgi:plasmid stabilization system protein ParE